jgi:valyl-tRNA synthetase
MSEEIPPRYDPREVEARLYPAWEARGDFRADAEAVLSGKRKPFVVMIPPPNVTGALHLGHALNDTLQDVLCRWHRMLGEEVLWLPGIDHAGIATQAVVEKRLFEERKLRRLDMGREAFLKEVWDWKERYGGTILSQLRSLGCSCDWSRTRFTMDGPDADVDLSFAVRKAFVDLFEEGLVYRGARIVNWDCALETAVSDDEIEHEDRKGKLWHIRYPRCDGNGFVVVATTRPETMLGDTGVAVHPGDGRYRGLVGSKVRLPLLGREIPVVADESVDPAFGTGAVKVTPGHDPEDYERGKRHGLPILVVLDGKGRVTKEGGPYAGLSREQARDRVLEDLEAQGLLEKVEDHALRVAISDRSRTVIEPLVSEQWFVRMEPLARPAIEAVKSGKLQFRPERWTKVYLDWLENVRDWCISRQLWWGHRIPVWYDGDGVPCALLADPATGAKHPKTGKPLVRQDEDVLDTWASSWLWPLATLGWPGRTEDLRAFYPTQFLGTAREIIYLWVARMVMAGYRFADHLPAERRCPFGTVYIHATILDAKGRRMSKSAGNGIDPVDMIAKYGADAVRFTLVDLTTEGQDVRLAENRFEVGRNFMNKLWNACRFAASATGPSPRDRPAQSAFAIEDRWILDELERVKVDATGALSGYQFHEYARVLYGFVWNEFCDWYLELIKPRLEAPNDEAVRWTLREVLGTVLRLLHPACPFVTEELSIRLGLLPDGCESLEKAPWPTGQWPLPGQDQSVITVLKFVVIAIRNLRAEYRVPEMSKVQAHIHCNLESAQVLSGLSDGISRLAKVEGLSFGPQVQRPPQSAVAHLRTPRYGEVEVFVPLAGHIDIGAEKTRLGTEIGKQEGFLAASDRKLGNADFAARAKPEVVEAERARREETAALVKRLRESLAALG